MNIVAMKGTPLNDGLVDYMNTLFPSEDELLRRLCVEAEAAGIPPIQISPEQGRFLGVMVKALGARSILEVGTLGGYSAIVMGRALPEGGRLDTIEIDPHHADFARRMIAEAGLDDKVTVHIGSGIDVLERGLDDDTTYDLVFIDADKPNYCRYVDLALPRVRTGGVIAGDNALAWGEVVDADTDRDDVRGIRAFNQYMSEHPRIDAAIVPIGDGMCIGVVGAEELV